MKFKNLLLIATLFSATATADSKTMTAVSIPLKADFVPTKALGLIISKKDVKQVADTQLNEIGPNKYLVSFSVDKDTTPLSTTLSAIAFSEDEKQSAFSDVKAFGNVITPPAKDICISADRENITARVKSIAVYKKLITIRKERWKSSRDEFLYTIDKKTQKKLISLAKGLGIPTEPTFDDPKLHPAELVDRLSRLEHALRNYLTGREMIENKNNEQ